MTWANIPEIELPWYTELLRWAIYGALIVGLGLATLGAVVLVWAGASWVMR